MKPLEVSKIYVIESLRNEDEKTGQSLFNDIIKRRLEQKGLMHNCELITPNSKEDLSKAFEHIKKEVIYNLVNPVIHFELHGSKEGLQLNNNDFVLWDELQFKLIELNGISGCNLFVTLASCYGGYIHTVIRPNLRTPFWGFVGPFEIVSTDEALLNFTAFYDEFLQSLDFNKAVDALNYANPGNKSKFRFQNTEYIFNMAYQNYEDKYLTPESVTKRLESGLIEARKHKELNGWSDEAIKNMLKFYMVDAKNLLKENMMTNFFMWDLFPHHKSK
ncbi:MAG: hypothetical protein ACTHLE_13560 [Agriterribacter sp.]